MYTDLFSYVPADLVASCTPLRAEVAAHLEDILRRARHGPAARSGAGATPTGTQAPARNTPPDALERRPGRSGGTELAAVALRPLAVAAFLPGIRFAQ